MTYKLVDHGYPFKKIMHDKKWVGRVCQHADGGWLGTIGKLTVRGTSAVDAFEQVVAQQLGYANAAALHAHNSAVRSQRRQAKAQAQYVLDAIMRGDFKPLDELFTKLEK